MSASALDLETPAGAGMALARQSIGRLLTRVFRERLEAVAAEIETEVIKAGGTAVQARQWTAALRSHAMQEWRRLHDAATVIPDWGRA
jgi:hypothetical protein